MTSSASTPWHGPLVLAAGSMLDQPPDVLADVAARAGFDGIGLRLSGEHAIDDLARFGQLATDRGLMIHDTEVYRIGDGATDPGALVEATVAVGAERLLVVSDHSDRGATVAALRELVERCGAVGVLVGLEYMAWTDPSAPRDAIDMALDTGCELLVDVLHHHRIGASLDDLDAIVASGTLGWVQWCDAPLTHPRGGIDALIHEARHGRLAPGDGELPLRAVLGRLPADVVISVEVQSDALLAMAPFERATLLHDAARAVLVG